MATGDGERGSTLKPFVILAAVVAGLLAVWGALLALVFSHPRTKAVVREFTSLIDAVERGREAPGVSELLETGCGEAFVITVAESWAFAAELIDEPSPFADHLMSAPYVYCRNRLGTAASPSCETVAGAYAEAANPDSQFLVVVHRPGDTQCTGWYAPTGEWLAAADDRMAPVLE